MKHFQDAKQLWFLFDHIYKYSFSILASDHLMLLHWDALGNSTIILPYRSVLKVGHAEEEARWEKSEVVVWWFPQRMLIKLVQEKKTLRCCCFLFCCLWNRAKTYRPISANLKAWKRMMPNIWRINIWPCRKYHVPYVQYVCVRYLGFIKETTSKKRLKTLQLNKSPHCPHVNTLQLKNLTKHKQIKKTTSPAWRHMYSILSYLTTAGRCPRTVLLR